LGIAQRTITAKYAPTSKNKANAKPLAESVKTIGDWIKSQRERKNLNPGHVASKMGIAHALILAWESNLSEPDSHQKASLARALGLDADAFTFPYETVAQAAPP
jgi:ribosome-binding protein aMBF1 (putative translation factor)